MVNKQIERGDEDEMEGSGSGSASQFVVAWEVICLHTLRNCV